MELPSAQSGVAVCCLGGARLIEEPLIDDNWEQWHFGNENNF